jgi:hypothetical protein
MMSGKKNPINFFLHAYKVWTVKLPFPVLTALPSPLNMLLGPTDE